MLLWTPPRKHAHLSSYAHRGSTQVWLRWGGGKERMRLWSSPGKGKREEIQVMGGKVCLRGPPSRRPFKYRAIRDSPHFLSAGGVKKKKKSHPTGEGSSGAARLCPPRGRPGAALAPLPPTGAGEVGRAGFASR